MASTTSTGPVQAKVHILQYDYVADVVEKRKPFRDAHLAFIGKYVQQGNVIMGGAYGNPPTGALILFRNLSADEVEQFAKQDPYVVNGIVTKHSVQPYMAVAGDPLLSNDLIKI